MSTPSESHMAAFIEYRKSLDTGILEISKSFHQLVTSFAAGALILSITFLEKIAPHPKHLWLLFLSWASLTLSIVAVVIGLVLDNRAFDKQTEIWNKYMAGEDKLPTNRALVWSWRGTILALALFCFGLTALVFFGAINVQEGSRIMKANSTPDFTKIESPGPDGTKKSPSVAPFTPPARTPQPQAPPAPSPSPAPTSPTTAPATKK
jgi:hypothetical protein